MKIIKNTKDFFDQCLDEIKLLKYIKANGNPDDYHILHMYGMRFLTFFMNLFCFFPSKPSFTETIVDYLYYKEHLFIVCELLRDNLYEFYKHNRTSGREFYFTFPRLQSITKQCLKAIQHIHSLDLIHCDLKPENILIKSYRRYISIK